AGKLKSAFLMLTPPQNRPLSSFVPTATRLTDSALVVMAAAQPAAPGGGRGGRGGGTPAALSPTCERQATRDSTAATRAAGTGGTFQFRRGGLSIADTTTLRWLEKQGVAA